MDTSLKNKILAAAEPYLAGKTVRDIAIGISLLACELSDGSIGVAYVLRDSLPPECGAFGFAEKLIGTDAKEAARLYVEGTDDIGRALGDAVLTAALSSNPDIRDDDSGDTFGLEPCENDTLGMVGLIKPVAAVLKGKVGELAVFDRGISRFYGDEDVLPDELQSEVLPRCNKVIITGSATINGSIDYLLRLCENAEKAIVVGSSTPMIREPWADTPVTALAGTCWKKEHRDEIFRIISHGGGIRQLKSCLEKKILQVK